MAWEHLLVPQALHRSSKPLRDTSIVWVCRSRAPTLRVAQIMVHSSLLASHRVVYSLVQKASRPRPRQRSGAAQLVNNMTNATTNLSALDTNSDAIAYAVLQYAMNTSDVNGEKGKGNFRVDPVDLLEAE